MLPPTSTNVILSLLRDCRTIHHVKQIHGVLITSSLSQDGLLTAGVLRAAALSLPGDIAFASLVFRQIKAPSASIWNTMLRGYSLRSHHEEAAMKHYCQMRRKGIAPNKHTYPLLLKAICKSRMTNPDQIHAQILRFGFGSDAFVRNSLVSVYAKTGELGSARNLFDGLTEKDPISWTSMVHGYASNHRADDGIAVFAEMKSRDVEIDEVVIVSAFNGAGMAGKIWLGRCVHGFYVECGRVRCDVFVGSALVDMYAKCGYIDDARQVFDEMPNRNVVTWSTMIGGYVQCDSFRNALSIFRDMMAEGLKPNQVTLASVLTACAQLGALDQGRWVHRYIDRMEMVPNTISGTALIDMYTKCGCISDAIDVFHRLSQKDVYVWTSLINGLAMHGLVEECLNFFQKMLQERVQPNEVTFLGVLCACSHGGLVDEGQAYFCGMFEDYGIEPKLEHYGCMVDLLGTAGHLEEALSVIESMPMEPSDGVRGALLSACIVHKNLVLGEKIGKLLVGGLTYHSGQYARLANMFSLFQKREEAASIRMAMRGSKIEKTPGCSWIELNGDLHEFFAFDQSHSQSKVIYETLHEMTMLMKLEGYLSNSPQLFLEMDARYFDASSGGRKPGRCAERARRDWIKATMLKQKIRSTAVSLRSLKGTVRSELDGNCLEVLVGTGADDLDKI